MATFPGFTLLTPPTRDQLVNFLIHFHDRISPLERAELGFPGA